MFSLIRDEPVRQKSESFHNLECGSQNRISFLGTQSALHSPPLENFIEGAQADKRVDYPTDDRSLSEGHTDQVDAEKTHETPVQGSYYEEYKGNYIECFQVHCFLLTSPFNDPTIAISFLAEFFVLRGDPKLTGLLQLR